MVYQGAFLSFPPLFKCIMETLVRCTMFQYMIHCTKRFVKKKARNSFQCGQTLYQCENRHVLLQVIYNSHTAHLFNLCHLTTHAFPPFFTLSWTRSVGFIAWLGASALLAAVVSKMTVIAYFKSKNENDDFGHHILLNESRKLRLIVVDRSYL